MFDKECIENLSSDKFEISLLNAIDSSLLLKKVGGIWTVLESNNCDTCVFSFASPYEAADILKMNLVLVDGDSCILCSETDNEKMELIRSMYFHGRKFKQLEKKADFLNTLCFQLSGLEKLLPSIMEPFPPDMALYFLMDSLSSIFTCSCAYYKLSGNKGELQSEIGSHHFRETVEHSRKIQYAELLLDLCECRTVVSDENGTEYLICFTREQNWQPEELSILKSILSLFCKYREFLMEKTKSEKSCDSLNQMGFIMEIIQAFSSQVLDSRSFKELSENLCDSLKEIFQATFAAIYVKTEYANAFTLNSHSSICGRLHLPEEVKNPEGNERMSFEFLPDEFKKLSITKIYNFKPDQYRDCFVITGESVIESYLSSEIEKILDLWLPLEITRSFNLLGAIQTMEHQKAFTQSIVNDMLYISENMGFLESKPHLDDILDSMNQLLMEKYGFSFEALKFGNYDISVPNSNIERFFLKTKSEDELDSKNCLLAKFASQQLSRAVEKSRISRPYENISDLMDIIKPLLESKYAALDFPDPSFYFELDLQRFSNLELLKKYGTGILVGNKIHFLSYIGDLSVLTYLANSLRS